MSVQYRPVEDAEIPELKKYITNLYTEDAGGEPMNEEKIEGTIAFLRANPQSGVIMAFLENDVLVGYSILINFYSNERGGIILHIDELYVGENYRGRNIATNFIQYLIDSQYNNCKAIFLEVRPQNLQAQRLYGRIGFRQSKTNVLTYVIQ